VYIRNILLPETNKKIEGRPVTVGEFVLYIGLWLLIATVGAGPGRRQFWDKTDPSPFHGAPFRLNMYMSRTRFDDITKSLTFTNIDAPAYKDKFHEVRQLLSEFNDHMKKIFKAGWISCLDESMSVWTRKWTCPGYVCSKKTTSNGK
jgi:hypothetical protein